MERNFHTCTITGLEGGWIELFAWAPQCPKFVSDCSRRLDVQNMPRPFRFQTIKEDRPMNKISTVYLERFNFSPLPYFFFLLIPHSSSLLQPRFRRRRFIFPKSAEFEFTPLSRPLIPSDLRRRPFSDPEAAASDIYFFEIFGFCSSPTSELEQSNRGFLIGDHWCDPMAAEVQYEERILCFFYSFCSSICSVFFFSTLGHFSKFSFFFVILLQLRWLLMFCIGVWYFCFWRCGFLFTYDCFRV